MKIYIFILMISFAQSTQLIPFDWVGQFGLIKKNGALLINSDWYSNRLFFDGTFSSYPKQYGDYIDQGFRVNNNYKSQSFNDSNYVNSHVIYDQGDYLLDRFSFEVKKIAKKDIIQLNGFKRSYVGDNNQYSNNSYQPLQQSYVLSFETRRKNEYGGFSIGHFDTFSGFPDTNKISLLKNKITTSNIFWARNFEKIKYIISIDNFLEKFYSNHSLSSYKNPRFLTRSLFKNEFFLPNFHDFFFSFGIKVNNRSIQASSSYLTRWYSYFLKGNYKFLNYELELSSYNHDSFFNYELDIEKYFGEISFKIFHKINNKPIHPYYYYSLNGKYLFSSEVYSFIRFKWDMLGGYFSSTLSRIQDKSPMWNNIIPELDSKSNLIGQELYFMFETSLSPNFGLKLNYNFQQLASYHSGGLGDWFGIDLSSNFSLFKGYMDLEIIGSLKHYNKRSISFYVNPIEMVPIFDKELSDLESKNIVNGRIIATVSSFKIKYEWFNILEILYNSLEDQRTNKIDIHPKMPSIGRQANLSIEWHFLD